MPAPSRSAWGLLVLAACHKSAPPGPDPDAIWDLAPDGTKVGLVATPRGLQLADRALAAARELMKSPDMAAIAPVFDSAVSSLVGNGSLAQAGLVPDQGFAVFGSPDGIVAILPVDRDKFLAAQQGTRGAETDTVHGQYCKQVGSVYACASAKALFDRIGKGSLRGKVATAGGRGDIEVYAQGLPILGKEGDAAVAIELEPGQLAVRASWLGALPADVAALAKVAAPRIDAEHTSGFAVAQLGSLLADATDTPLVAGVTVKQLATTIAGPLFASVPAGTTDVQLQIPLTDPAPATALVDHCDDIGKVLAIKTEAKPGACHLTVQGLAELDADAWVEGNEIRIGGQKGVVSTAKQLALTPIGSELAGGKWTYAFWGRGSILQASPSPHGELGPEAKLTMRILALVEELGGGIAIAQDGLHVRGVIRTVWANQDDVAAKLAAITADDAASKGPELGAPIATASPDSPFAADYVAGKGGLLIPSAAASILVKMVVPAILRYRQAP